jgi:peptide/nickel transport system substrate-binding protein
MYKSALLLAVGAAAVSLLGVGTFPHLFATADERPQSGGELKRRLTADVTTLNPVRASSLNDRYVADYLYTPLIELDHDLRPIAGLATKWEMSSDGTVYRFTLNDSATFSDGTPVRASDVVFTLNKAVDKTSEAPQIGGSFEELDTRRTRSVGKDVVEVAFRHPLAGQLLEFNRLFVIPEHIYGKGDFKRFDGIAVGSGPYILVRHELGRQLLLRRRETYWREKPYIETVRFKVIDLDATAWEAIKLGEIDETSVSSDTWLRHRRDPAIEKTIRFQKFYTFNYNFVAWNGRHPILRDSGVRRALAMCIPVDSIIENLYHGTARRLTGPFMPESYAYNRNVREIPFQPQTAKQVLASLGWTDHDHDGILDRRGTPLVFTMTIEAKNEFDRLFAQTVQDELKHIGVEMKILPLEEAAFFATVMKGDYDAAALGTSFGLEPHPFTFFHSSQGPGTGMNFTYYRKPEVDRLIIDGERELDLNKRRDLYWRLHEILAKDQPFTWTVQVSEKWALRTRVLGVEASKGYGLFRWHPGELGWWIPKLAQSDQLQPRAEVGSRIFTRPYRLYAVAVAQAGV